MSNTLPTPFQRLLTILLFCFASSSLVQAGTLGPLTYQVSGDTVSITDCDTSVTNVVVPASIESKPVTAIGSSAFRDCSSLTGITLPASLTHIKSSAFENCSSLANITIPDGVISIWSYAFSDCSSLTSITIPDGVSSIGSSTFRDCSSLVNITIPDGVTSIGGSAFYYCSSLTGITIPASVTSIGDIIFGSCSGLEFINVEAGNPNYASMDGVLFNASQTILIQYPEAKPGHTYSIPNGIISISSGAFIHCSSLTGITLPAGITSIGSWAFSYCSALTDITLPAGITGISDYAFRDCSSLTDITIPASATSIESAAFYRCSSLTNITIPASVTSIGSEAFHDCSSLSSINIETGNPSYTSSGGVLFNADQTELIVYPAKKPDLTYSVPASVTMIDTAAFKNCSVLSSLTLPSSITSIGYSAFMNCDSLGIISIPVGVSSIGSDAFSSCDNLTAIHVPIENLHYSSIDGVLFNADQTQLIRYPGGKTGYYTIPASVTSMYSAFRNSPGLTGILLPQWISSIYEFSGCSGLEAIDVEAGHPQYSSLDGVVFNTNRTELIKYPESKPGPYSVPAGVTDIRYGAFEYCNALSEIAFSGSVTNVSPWAFRWSSSVTNIAVDTGVSFFESSFLECRGLQSIHVAAGHPDYTSVDGVLFNKDLSELIAWPAGRTGSYAVPDGVTLLGSDSFSESGLTGITLPGSVTNIAPWTFSQCHSLTNITIPATITDIGFDVFNPCDQLRSATFLGDAPATFGYGVFDNTAAGFTIYYSNKNTGFTSPSWKGYPATSWFMDNGLDPINANLDQDMNGDGVDLLMAYALNLDPTLDLSDSLPQAVLAPDAMSMAYHAASPGITYTVETSTNLVDWTDTGVSLSGLDGNNEVTATIDTTVPHRFLRLRVEK